MKTDDQKIEDEKDIEEGKGNKDKETDKADDKKDEDKDSAINLSIKSASSLPDLLGKYLDEHIKTNKVSVDNEDTKPRSIIVYDKKREGEFIRLVNKDKEGIENENKPIIYGESLSKSRQQAVEEYLSDYGYELVTSLEELSIRIGL